MSKTSTLPGTSTTDDATANPKPGPQARSENNSGDDGDTGDEQGDPQFTPITSQADLDRIVSTRLDRQKRQLEQRFSDYDDKAQKAKAYDDLQAAGKSEAEKAQDRAKALEQELAQERKARHDAEVGAARTAYAAKHSIPEVLLSGEDESHWDAQRKAHQDAVQASAPKRGRAPGSGTGDPTHSTNRGAGRSRADEYLKTHKI